MTGRTSLSAMSASEGLPTRTLSELSLHDLRSRIQTFVEIAADNGSTISFGELRTLLPSTIFPSDEVLQRFISMDDRLSTRLASVGREVAIRGREALAEDRRAQRSLTVARLRQANRFVDVLSRICPWIRVAGVSGSTAYGGAKPSDDIDFFLVTARDRLWLSLLLALVTARLVRTRTRSSTVYCFNRILDEETCMGAFASTRDPLFAREALNLRVLRGGDAYRDLLAAARWMEGPFPNLYRTRTEGPRGTFGRRSRGARPFLRGLDLAVAIFLGSYLVLAGLRRNKRLLRQGRRRECFRTVVRRGFYATESVLYDELREAYRRIGS